MKKIALLASVMALVGVSGAYAATTGTVGITGTVPTIREISLSNAAGTVDLSAMTTATLASASYAVTGSTLSAVSNHEDWQITAAVASTGSEAAVANSLSHSTIDDASTPAGFANQITVGAITVGGNPLPYLNADNATLLKLTNSAIALTLSSTNPLIAGAYTGDVTFTIAVE